MFDRRDKIVAELLSTEKSYVEDLKIVLTGYKAKVGIIKNSCVSLYPFNSTFFL